MLAPVRSVDRHLETHQLVVPEAVDDELLRAYQ